MFDYFFCFNSVCFQSQFCLLNSASQPRITALMCFAKEFAGGFSVPLVKFPLFFIDFIIIIFPNCTGLHLAQVKRGENSFVASYRAER